MSDTSVSLRLGGHRKIWTDRSIHRPSFHHSLSPGRTPSCNGSVYFETKARHYLLIPPPRLAGFSSGLGEREGVDPHPFDSFPTRRKPRRKLSPHLFHFVSGFRRESSSPRPLQAYRINTKTVCFGMPLALCQYSRLPKLRKKSVNALVARPWNLLFFSKVNAKEASFLVLMAELVKSSFFHFTIEPPFSEDPLMHLGA